MLSPLSLVAGILHRLILVNVGKFLNFCYDPQHELPNMIQIMLRRRILPFQDRAFPMWAYKLEDPTTVLSFFCTSHARLWKALFKPQKEWPAEEEYIGLDAKNPLREV